MAESTAHTWRSALALLFFVYCLILLCSWTARPRFLESSLGRPRGRALLEPEPWRDLDPRFDECAQLYATQNWMKLNIPKAPRSVGAGLQSVAEALSTFRTTESAAQEAVHDPHTSMHSEQGTADSAALLARIFERPLRFNESDFARSQSHLGDGSRLRTVMDKLLKGQPISAVILGGSIENGADIEGKRDAYFGQVSDWINTTFPVAPGAGSHTFHNLARSASGSPFFASCLQDHIPDKDFDLAFIQFDVNDNQRLPYMNNPHRRSLEMIFRKLLQFPNRPALVYLHFWAPTGNIGQWSFWNHTVQPESGLLVNYYGLPSVSLRDVWFHKFARNQYGFRCRDVMCGINHPNLLGHQYMADLVIAMLQNYAAATTLFPLSQADRDMAHQAFPEPMLPGNWDGATGACVHDETLHLAALQGSAQGFAWVDDTTSYGAHRWGWAAEHVRDSMELQVDTSIPGSPSGAEVWLSVAVLMSYEHMGTAVVECVRNCECKPMPIDALWELRMSIKEHWNLRVTASPNCVVRLSNTGPERPNGNRFKLEALTVRPGEYFMGEGMHHFGSERDHAMSGGTQGFGH